jgi:hypothetical protein
VGGMVEEKRTEQEGEGGMYLFLPWIGCLQIVRGWVRLIVVVDWC